MNVKQWIVAATLMAAGLMWHNSGAQAAGLPMGEYVFDSVSSDSSEAVNDPQIHTSASNSSGTSGSVSLQAQDSFNAGYGIDTISRSEEAWTTFGITYRWETPNDTDPADYTYVTDIRYSGSCTAQGANLDGSWSGGAYGGDIAPGGSANANHYDVSPTQSGSSYISLDLYLQLTGSLDMTAHQSSVSGSLSQSLSGAISGPIY